MAVTAAQLDVRFTSSGASQVKGELRDLKSATDAANSGFNTFKNTMLGIGTALIAPVGIGLKMATDLEQSMANVNASLGGVDTSVLKELEQGFLDIGAASQFSAIQVAAVGDELAKAGWSPDQIVIMTQATVDLSQATGTDLMTSVTGINAAMQLWSPTIVDNTIALTDATRAADIFTAAANASSADVHDIIAGVRNLGPTAASIGIPFEDTASAIALFTNYGLKAADSGVSLTRGLQELFAIASDSPEVLDQFGISLFDLNGNFVGLPALFDQLNAAFGDLSPAAREAALSTLFGAESIDVMTIAALTGGDPLRAIIELTKEQGIAAEQSALRMNTLKAQFGELMESGMNLLGRMMSGLIPGLRMLTDGANMVLDVFSRIPDSILRVVGTFAGLLAGIAAITKAIRGFALLNTLLGGAGLLGGISVGAVVAPLLAIAAAVGAVYAAIRFNLGGIGDAIHAFKVQWDGMIQMRDPISAFFSALGAALRSFDVGLLDSIGSKLEQFGNKVDGFLDGFRDAWDFVFGDGATRTTEKNAEKQSGAAGLLSGAFGYLRENLTDTVDPLDKVRHAAARLIDPTADAGFAINDTAGYVEDMTWAAERAAYPMTTVGRVLAVVGEAFRRADMPGIADAFDATARAVDVATGAFRDFRDQGAGPVSSAILALGVAVPPLERAMQGLAGVTENLGDAFIAAVRGDWSQALEELGMAAGGVSVVIDEIADAVSGLIVDLAGWTVNVGVPAVTGWIVDAAGDVWSAISTAAGWAWDGLVTLGAWTLETAVPAVTGWIQTAAANAWDAIKSAAGWAGITIARLGDWALHVGTPAITGWLQSSAGNIWEALKSAAGWSVGAIQRFGDWTLHVGTPAITGWLSDAAGIATTIKDRIIAGIAGLNISSEDLAGVGTSVAAALQGAITTGLQGLADMGADFYNWLSTTIDGIEWNALGFTIGEGLGTAIRWGMSTLIVGGLLQGELFNWIGTALLNVDWMGLAQAVGSALLSMLQAAVQFSQGFAAGLFKGLFDPIKDEIDGVLEYLKNQWNDFAAVVNNAPGVDLPMFDTAKKRADDLAAALQNVKKSFKDALGFVTPTVYDQPVSPDKPPLPPGAYPGDIEQPSDGGPLGRMITQNIDRARTAMDAYRASVDATTTSTKGYAVEGDRLQRLIDSIAAQQQVGATNAYDHAGALDILRDNAVGAGVGVTLYGESALRATSQVQSLGTAATGIAASIAAMPPATITIEADAGAAATAIGDTIGQMAALNGTTSTVQVLGDNAGALAAIADSASALGAINGQSALTFVNGDNSNALGAVMGAAAAIAGVDGASATTYIYAESFVQSAVDAARAALASIDGASATVSINTVGGAGINIGQKLATGGYVRSQYQIVGERGPELVSLPYGSYVHTAAETRSLMAEGIAPPRSTAGNHGAGTSGDTYEIHVHVGGHVVGVSDLADEIAGPVLQKIASVKQRRDLAKGVAA